MNKKKWGKTAAGLKEKLQFLRLDEDLDDEDDLEVEEEEIAPGRTLQEELKDKLARKKRNLKRLRLVLFGAAVIAVFGFWLYNPTGRYQACERSGIFKSQRNKQV